MRRHNSRPTSLPKALGYRSTRLWQGFGSPSDFAVTRSGWTPMSSAWSGHSPGSQGHEVYYSTYVQFTMLCGTLLALQWSPEYNGRQVGQAILHHVVCRICIVWQPLSATPCECHSRLQHPPRVALPAFTQWLLYCDGSKQQKPAVM